MRKSVGYRAAAIASAAAAVLYLSAACGGAADVADPPAAAEGAWQLASGAGPGGDIATVEGHRITLVLEAGRAGGTAACNSYGASVRVTEDRFALGELSKTEMGCEPDVMAAEAAYLEALQRVDGIRRTGNRLVLSGPSTELTFEPLPPVPTEPLVDTTWELESVITGDTASNIAGPRPTLRLTSDGSIRGETGCRSFTGRYVVRGDEVVVTRFSAAEDPTAGRCPPDAEAQHDHVVQVVGDRFRAEIEGDRLTLTSSGGYGLIYRSR